MNPEYQNNELNTSANSDEVDEFGGGKLTFEIFYRNQKQSAIVPTIEIDMEDDEFGGGKVTLAMLTAKRTFTPITEKIEVSEVLELLEVEEQEEESLYTCDYNIFSPFISINKWYVNREKLSNIISEYDASITIPLVIDTEYTENKNGKKEYQQKSRLGLTTQICGIDNKSPKGFYGNTPQVNAGRLLSNASLIPMIESDFHPVDYLRSLGLDVEIREATETELAEIPKCYIVLYGHFLTAEINMIASGTVKNRLKTLQRSKGEEQIISGRRAYCQSVVDGQKVDWVSLRHIVSIEGYEYNLCLKLVDTGAIHGIASYKDFCNAVGWKLQFKDNFTSEEKSKMLDMAIERFEDFENYALGDLEVYEALNAYYEQWQVVYEKLGLLPYFQCPKLTIGGTVKDLFEAALASALKIQPKDEKGRPIWRKPLAEVVDQFIKPASANDLRQFTTHTRALLAKVEGGRCRNNRPTDIFIRRKIKGKYDAVLICDIDISGCYGEGQRNQSYFLGCPEIMDYKTSKNNNYISLREWLKAYDVQTEELIRSVSDKNSEVWKNDNNWGELISGAWYARINTKEKLKYAQDYFASWFTESSVDKIDLLAKSIREMKSDTEMVSSDWSDFDEDCGSLKIFNHEIHNGALTHDGLQWILAIASPRQRNELLDNIQILSSSVYPRSQKLNINNPKEALNALKDCHENWKGRNTTNRIKIDGRSKIVMNFDECHNWFDINLGDLLVNNLLIERKKAQKVYGKKSPLDTLFKLCVNTLYGDMVSKFFITSNPVVGNNITARARALAWYMEKGLHGWQSITDGCAFELSGVLYPQRDNINGEVVNQYRNKSKLKQRMIKRSPIANSQEILGYWVEYKSYNKNKPENTEIKFALGLKIDNTDIAPIIKPDKEHERFFTGYSPANAWIDENAMTHLQNLFPLIDVLHNESSVIKIDDNLNVNFQPRIGQFSFETKDIYHSGAFHGSANYVLTNPNGVFVKARGYETKRQHTAIESERVSEGDEITFMKSERYGVKNNPANDFMNQLLNNPENIKRQLPAVKSGILKITDYKNLSRKYDNLGIEPGDSILRTFLMQEFSLSQFTFQTYEQYMMWKKIISHLKDTDRQSLEGFFLNDDGTLDFIKLCNWVDEQIAEGIEKPFDLLSDSNRNDKRAEKRTKNPVECGKGKGKKQKVVSLSHPHLNTFNALRNQLKESDLNKINVEE